MCELCSKLTTKTSEQPQWRHFGVFIVNLEHISHLFLLTLSMYLFAGKKYIVAYDLLFSWKQAAVNEVNGEPNKNQNTNKKTSRLLRWVLRGFLFCCFFWRCSDVVLVSIFVTFCTLMQCFHYRSSRLEVFCRKGFYRSFAELTGKHLKPRLSYFENLRVHRRLSSISKASNKSVWSYVFW